MLHSSRGEILPFSPSIIYKLQQSCFSPHSQYKSLPLFKLQFPSPALSDNRLKGKQRWGDRHRDRDRHQTHGERKGEKEGIGGGRKGEEKSVHTDQLYLYHFLSSLWEKNKKQKQVNSNRPFPQSQIQSFLMFKFNVESLLHATFDNK